MRFLVGDGSVTRDLGRFPEPGQRVVLANFLARGEHELDRRLVADMDPPPTGMAPFHFAPRPKPRSPDHPDNIDTAGGDCVGARQSIGAGPSWSVRASLVG